jgi:hypothetical protein
MVAVSLDLVVHHRYTDGTAADLSGYGNDGHAFESRADLSAFDGQSTRLVVFPAPSLDALGAVRARARILVEELGDRRTIVEGYLAFAFGVEADGALAASVLTAHRWDGVRSAPGAVPLNRWIDVACTYDGRDTSLLTVDGAVVATRCLPLGRVAGVQWPYGLNVGAWPDGNLRVFKGRIAELWLWREAR